jgi:mono/diheme cytochrome c family protein
MTSRPFRPGQRRGVIVAIAALVLGFPGIVWSGQVRERDPNWTAPSNEISRPNPLAGRPEAAAGGAKVFHQRCASCHGADAHGTAKAPDLSGPDVLSQTDGALFWKISSGNAHAGMPGFSFLPAPQRWQLVLQLRTLRPSP